MEKCASLTQSHAVSRSDRRAQNIRRHTKRQILDKYGQPLDPKAVLEPGKEILVDGKPFTVPGERMTAAAAVASGDPVRGAAASAFTQKELDALAVLGIKPWEPKAREALEKLQRAEARAEAR